jgi:hypothetical protein
LPDLLSKAVATTGNAESDVLSNARELENQSGMLRHAVDEFLARFARRERVTYASGKPGLTPWRPHSCRVPARSSLNSTG